MMRLFRSLRRDQRGASIIELALVLPVFSALVVGVVDISRAYSQKLLLEQAAYRAIEKVQQYQSTKSTYNTLQDEVAAAAADAGMTDVGTKNSSGVYTNITIDYWLECNGVRQGNGTPGNGYDGVCSGSQTYGRWITVDASHAFWPMFANKRWPGSNANGSYTLHGRAALRTQ